MANTIMQRPVRSLLHPRSSVDTPETEPLPVYTPRNHEPDPETASIVSEAPTYRSEAPAYSPASPEPLIGSSEEPPIGLPYRRFAPGFEARPNGPVSDIRAHSYSIANWTTARGGPVNRTYENVAKRRMRREASVTDVMQVLSVLPASAIETQSPSPPPPPTATITSPVPAPIISSASACLPSPTIPYSPAEDPDLVGEAAASKARSQRLYRESCIVDQREALRCESRSWDFMAIQMKDWEERGQSWNNFRKDIESGRRGKLARRIGFGRRSS